MNWSEKLKNSIKILSLNCNGIRSASKKGLENFILKENFDILCFQEIKAKEDDINLDFYNSSGYSHCINPADKKGYSGTAIFYKQKASNTYKGMNSPIFDGEGRVILIEYPEFTLVNSYFPSGSSGEERQEMKIKFLKEILPLLNKWKSKYKNIILTGDINIAHKEIDIHDPKGNKNSSGFLPEERKWIDDLITSGWVDAFRLTKGELKDIYSWWTYRFSARKKNKGWRIDYFFVSDTLKDKIIDCGIYTEMDFSDHAPIFLNIKV